MNTGDIWLEMDGRRLQGSRKIIIDLTPALEVMLSWNDIRKNQLRYEVKNSDILPEYTEERAKMKVLREEDKLGD